MPTIFQLGYERLFIVFINPLCPLVHIEVHMPIFQRNQLNSRTSVGLSSGVDASFRIQ